MSIKSIMVNLPDEAHRSVLFSLTGSVNASLIGIAASVVAQLHREGFDDIRAIEVRDVVGMLNSNENTELVVLNTRKLARVGQTLRDKLIELSNDDSQGSINGSLDFMTSGSTRSLDEAHVAEVLKLMEVDIDIKHLQLMNKTQQIQRAERLAAQRGEIEWLLDQVFIPHDSDETVIDGEFKTVFHDVDAEIEDLPEEMRERLMDKFIAGLERAMDTAALGLITRDRRYTFSDVALVKAALAEAKSIDSLVKVPVTKGKKAKEVVTE